MGGPKEERNFYIKFLIF